MPLMKYIVHAQISIAKFIKQTDGASGIEYAIIAAMVAVFIATLTPGVQTAISTVFTKITTALAPAS